MRRLCAALIIIVMLGVGCDSNNRLEALYELNGSVDANPDSVLELLLEMNTVMDEKEASDETRALYGLVLTKAADKAHKMRLLLGRDPVNAGEESMMNGGKDAVKEGEESEMNGGKDPMNAGKEMVRNEDMESEASGDGKDRDLGGKGVLVTELGKELVSEKDSIVLDKEMMRGEWMEKYGDVLRGDSLIQRSVEYYEGHVECGLLAEAYYYAGRTNGELLNGDKALMYYQKALMKDSEHISNHVRSRIYAQMGVMYLRNGLIADAQQMGELALFYCQQDSDTLGIRICEEAIESMRGMEAKGDSSVSDEKKTLVTMKVLRINEQLKSDLLNNRNVELSRENEKRKALIWMIIGCVMVVALGAVWMVRRQLKERRKLYEEMGTVNAVKRQFYDRETDEMIRRNVRNEKPLKEKEWQEIEAKVAEKMPGFRERLNEVYQFSEQEYRICILIKMGVSPSEISTLMATSRSNVSQTRQRMQKKVFNGRGSAKDWDRYIMSL